MLPYRGLLEPVLLPVDGDEDVPLVPVAGDDPVVDPEPVVDDAPGVPVVGEPVLDEPLETPLAGGVVLAPPPAAGGHGIAVPLVPTAPDVDDEVLVPVLRPVVDVDPLVPFAALFGAPAAADGDPDWASGPASVALLTVSLDDVVVPVELLIRLCGSLACAESDPGVPVAPGAPVVVPADAAPVTGTHGAELGVVVLDCVPALWVPVPVVPWVVVPGDAVPCELVP